MMSPSSSGAAYQGLSSSKVLWYLFLLSRWSTTRAIKNLAWMCVKIRVTFLVPTCVLSVGVKSVQSSEKMPCHRRSNDRE